MSAMSLPAKLTKACVPVPSISCSLVTTVPAIREFLHFCVSWDVGTTKGSAGKSLQAALLAMRDIPGPEGSR